MIRHSYAMPDRRESCGSGGNQAGSTEHAENGARAWRILGIVMAGASAGLSAAGLSLNRFSSKPLPMSIKHLNSDSTMS